MIIIHCRGQPQTQPYLPNILIYVSLGGPEEFHYEISFIAFQQYLYTYI